LGGLIATNAIAIAAHNSVPTVATRTDEAKRFRLNQRGIFMFVKLRYQLSFRELSGDSFLNQNNRQHF
jgi:hypothetical protein